VAKKTERLESELVVETRRRLLDGSPDDAAAAELVVRKRCKTIDEAKRIVAKARRAYRAKIGYEELAERCFELYESARESGDARGALLALRQWEKWTNLVHKHTMAKVAQAPIEDVEEVLVRMMLSGDLNPTMTAQLKSVRRREVEATPEVETDVIACTDEEALAIALGKRR
jgi:cobalamin biosynthesis protein CobT